MNSDCRMCEKTCCPNWKPVEIETLPLNNILKIKKWSQKKLAEKTGLTPACISQICGWKRDPKVSTLKKIAEALNVPMDKIRINNG